MGGGPAIRPRAHGRGGRGGQEIPPPPLLSPCLSGRQALPTREENIRYTFPIAVLPILQGQENPILRKKTQEVARVTKDILQLLRDMKEAMDAAKGVGLAAPQIGLSLRICIAVLHGKTTAFINPYIIWRSAEEEIAEEGCLSLPDTWVPVSRACAITVRFQNKKGKEEERKLEGLPARILQHEIDHLEGILITDYQLQTHAKP